MNRLKQDAGAFLTRFFPGGVGVLRCPVQRYPWGLPGAQALAGRLGGVSASDVPCAECWMGAHPKASAELVTDEARLSLRTAIVDFPGALLGERISKRWGSELPFLFKVLSIGAPLSIQAHPDSAFARELHARDPINYPDPFHKPEIGVALTPVEILAGFQPPRELTQRLREYPELAQLVGPTAVTAEQMYRGILGAAEDRYVDAATAVYRRVVAQSDRISPAERYFCSMFDEYGPADRGLFSLLVLNLVTLSPGEGIFIGPNLPHAYLSGELVECMANSDNVVRAGLTRKFQDRETLISMLDFAAVSPTILTPNDHRREPGRVRFPPAPEFVLERCTAVEGRFDFGELDSLVLVLVLRGEARVHTSHGERSLTMGEVGVVPAAARPWTLDLIDGDVFVAAVPAESAAPPKVPGATLGRGG